MLTGRPGPDVTHAGPSSMPQLNTTDPTSAMYIDKRLLMASGVTVDSSGQPTAPGAPRPRRRSSLIVARRRTSSTGTGVDTMVVPAAPPRRPLLKQGSTSSSGSDGMISESVLQAVDPADTVAVHDLRMSEAHHTKMTTLRAFLAQKHRQFVDTDLVAWKR